MVMVSVRTSSCVLHVNGFSKKETHCYFFLFENMLKRIERGQRWNSYAHYLIFYDAKLATPLSLK